MRATTIGRIFGLLLAGIAAAGGGCAGHAGGKASFAPQSRPIRYQSEFDHAYARPTTFGGYELIATRAFLTPRLEGRTVVPAYGGELSQIMHIKVAWHRQRSARGNFPAATNASIRMLHMAGTVQAPAWIEYQGIGFVAVAPSDKFARFTFHDLLLHPTNSIGDVKDPLGTHRLSGEVIAQVNPEALQQTLLHLNDLTGDR